MMDYRVRLVVRCVGAHDTCSALQDAMARVAGVGKPDAFVTATTNAYWPEVVSSLQPGQDPVDRPDLIARVFIQKIKHLMHLLLDCGILGKVKAHVGMIEFQKRGLPHFHLLLVFDEEGPPSGCPGGSRPSPHCDRCLACSRMLMH